MKPKVAFVCVHNSCRSQMAEAIGKLKWANSIEVYSAGTETKPKINEDAVYIIKQKYGVDINDTQYSKNLNEIPKVDVVVTMGCNVDCPWLPSKHREDWGLNDPTGKSKEAFEETLNLIEEKLEDLVKRINNGLIG